MSSEISEVVVTSSFAAERSSFLSAILAVLVLLLNLFPVKEARGQELAIDDLESETLQGWSANSLVWRDGAGHAADEELCSLSINRDPEYVKQGKQSVKLKCWAVDKKNKTNGYLLIYRTLPKAPTLKTDALSMWIHGKKTGGSGRISVNLLIPGGRRVASSIPVNFEGWRRVTLGPADWTGKENWKDLWEKLYLVQLICNGNFEVCFDDLKFITTTSLQEEAEQAVTPRIHSDRQDVLYADFSRQETGGLKFINASLKSAQTTVKDRKKCIVIKGKANTYKQYYLNAEDNFLPEEGCAVAVTIEYYDHGTQPIYLMTQASKAKLLYYTAPGSIDQRITNTQKREWLREVFYFPEAFFPNANGERDLFFMLKGDIYLTWLSIRKFGTKDQKAWENFYYGEMDRMAETYGNIVVAQAYMMDEVRQAVRAVELLAAKADVRALEKDEREIDERVKDLLRKYVAVYYDTKARYCDGTISQDEKDAVVAGYLAYAREAQAKIDAVREKATTTLKTLEEHAGKQSPWYANFNFEYRSFAPLPASGMIPKEVFGKRYLVGVPYEPKMCRPASIRPFGLIFTNRGLSSGYLPAFSTGEGQYDFSRMDANMKREAEEFGLRGTLYPVFGGWWRKYLPAWFVKKHGDDIYPQSHDGHIGVGGGNRFHPALKKLWIDYAAALGRHLKENPNLFMAMFMGEMYHHVGRKPADNTARLEDGYSPVARSEFRKYLRNKYETIDALNKELQAGYADFEAIQPPTGVETRSRLTPLLYVFETFRHESAHELEMTVFRAYKEADPSHHLTSMGGSHSEFDELTLDAIGTNSGGFGLSHHYPFSMCHYYSINRLSGKPMICREFNMTSDEGRMGIASTRKELRAISERGFWQTSAWGQSGALLFNIGSGNDNIMENDASNSVIRWFAGNVPQMRDKWDRLSKVYTGTEIVHYRVGYLRTAQRRLVTNSWSHQYSLMHNTLRELHKRLFVEHYNWFFVNDRSLFGNTDTLDDYRIAILEESHVQEELKEMLLAWVRNGGTLILSGGAGAYDKMGRDRALIHEETLGLSKVTYDPKKAKEIGIIHYGDSRIDVKKSADYFWRADGGKAKPGAKVLGTYSDGSPAILAATYGKGKVYASLFPVGINEKTADIFMGWLKETVGIPAATCDEPLVEPVVREDKEGNRYLLITNVNYDRAVDPQFVLDGEYRKLVDLGLGNGIPVRSRREHGLTIFTRRLAPGEGTIVWLGKQRKTSKPDAKAKVAWVEYLAVEKKVSESVQRGMDVEAEAKILAGMKQDIEKQRYAKAASKAGTVNESIERKVARRGSDALAVLAKELTKRIDDSKHDAVSKARIHALRDMGEYAIRIDRGKAESYLNRVKGQINLPELPVRRTEIDFLCPKTETPVKIDGVLEEWTIKKWEKIPSSRAWHGNPRDDKDISAEFATMCDDKSLYIAIKTTDDIVMNRSKEKPPIAHAQDGVEIHLNILDDYGIPKEGGMGDGLPVPIYGPDDFQFIFDSYGGVYEWDSPRNALRISKAKGSRAAVRNTDKGYDMEIAIPWSAVFLKPVPGYTIGFTISVNDTDHKKGQYGVQITYRGRQVCENTEGWGRLELGGK